MSNKRKTFAVILSILIVFTLCFIFGNSLKTQSQSVVSSGGVFEKVKPFLSVIFGEGQITHSIFREFAHFAEFFVLGLEVALLFFVVFTLTCKIKVFAHLIGLIIAVIDESLQFLTDRGPEIIDVLIDFVGYLSALLFIVLIITIVKRFESKKPV